jgi:predicted PurR-regulated permease PerM
MERETSGPKLPNGIPSTSPEVETDSSPQLRISELLHGSFDVRSLALIGLFILAVFYTIFFMRAILLPLVLALLLSYLLRPIVRSLHRLRIAAPIGAALVLIAVVTGIGVGISYLAAPAASWLQKAPYSLRELQHKLSPIKQPMEKVAQATGEIEKLATPQTPEAKTAVELKRHPIAETVVGRTPEFIAMVVLIIILLYFLLAFDGVFLRKLIKLLPALSDKKRAVSIASEIESNISRYLFTVTAINICLGAAVGTTVGLLGLRNPVMWGALVATLNFVPYVGAFTGIISITLGAILSFDSLGYALIFPGVYLGFAVLEGNFITPWIMGRSLTLNPVIVLLSLTFWGWLWGIAGVILAVPILAVFKILCAHIEPMEPIAEFLS